MNERDSEEVLGMLTSQGYAIASQPEEADVVLLNTCSVREHAEERAFGKMGELSALKRARPEMVLGIIGCMAKLRQDDIFKRLPAVDVVAGPAELYDLPYLLAEIQARRQRDTLHASRDTRVMAVGRAFRPLEQKPQASHFHKPGLTAFVTIMEGCDKACTYCIVPKTRGQEISRPAEEIIAEIHDLAAAGYQEITLLGQNVNSYGKRFPNGSGYKGPLGRLRLLQEKPDHLLDFPQLLRLIDASLAGAACLPSRGRAFGSCSPFSANSPQASPRDGIEALGRPALDARSEFAETFGRELRAPTPAAATRIRFTTSHPFDADMRLFEAMRDCRSVCEWLHLPVQSGSNRLLRAMRRGYTRKAYLDKIAQLRGLIPDISLSTDIIAGFPGETQEDFEQTVALMRQVGYDNAYIFKYSPRPGTDAAAREDDVPKEAKDARNQALLALQEEIALKRFRRFEGRMVEVLMEGPGRRAGQSFGRTRGNQGVIVESQEPLTGAMRVRIVRATSRTLFGARCPE